jgi:hypothetical protein
MKRILLAATLFAACSAMADLVATNRNGDEMRLMPGPCVHAGILGHIGSKEARARLKKGQAWVDGKLLYVCWVDTGDGAYWVVCEDGEGRSHSVTSFTDKPGA